MTIWTDSNESRRAPEAGQYLQGVLKSIGINAKLKVINAAVYWTTVGNQATKAQIGFADWFQDYPHPVDWVRRPTERKPDHWIRTTTTTPNFDILGRQRQDRGAEEGARPSRQGEHAVGADDKLAMERIPPWAPYTNDQGIDTFGTDAST